MFFRAHQRIFNSGLILTYFKVSCVTFITQNRKTLFIREAVFGLLFTYHTSERKGFRDVLMAKLADATLDNRLFAL